MRPPPSQGGNRFKRTITGAFIKIREFAMMITLKTPARGKSNRKLIRIITSRESQDTVVRIRRGEEKKKASDSLTKRNKKVGQGLHNIL